MAKTSLDDARYDHIGKSYDTTRKADPYLADRMYHLLKNEVDDAQYLDIGCGSGNYTNELHLKGLKFIGIDPSQEMLSKAKVKNREIHWRKGKVENIELDDNSIEGVLVSLTMHHWDNLYRGFQEIARVLKPGARVVIFTTFPDQTDAYWLKHYFPLMIQESIAILPTKDEMMQAFDLAKIELLEQEPYFVQRGLQDLFLYSGKYNPEMYFNEKFRRGVSSFSLIAQQNEIDSGLSQLRADIDSGHFRKIADQHKNDLGDYMFLVGRKNA